MLLPEQIVGCVFSNELLDALPVHRVQGDQEVYVTAGFEEALGPLSDARLPRLPEGYRSEFNLRALDWLDGRRAAAAARVRSDNGLRLRTH